MSNGTRLSWNGRFQRVAAALVGDDFEESKLHEDWTQARKGTGLTAPDAYAMLVDAYFVAAESKREPNHGISACGSDINLVGELAWLPRWCLVDYESAAQNKPSNENCDLGVSTAMLWFGDIPGSMAAAKRVAEVIHDSKPQDMPEPFVRKVVTRGYRSETLQLESTDAEVRDETDEAPILGYAFVEFRDKAEADGALTHFNGMKVGGWRMRVNWAEERHQGKVQEGRKLGVRLKPGQDPPLGEQLFPSSLHGHALMSAVRRHYEATGACVNSSIDAWVIAEVIKAYYRNYPRQEIITAGHKIPTELLAPLIHELKETRWPSMHHRTGMQAEQYLVLYRGKSNDGYANLLSILCVILEWAEPEFGWNRIAVTKDFQGTPHIDGSDVTYQYAISVGSFDTGGQLCVEGDCPSQVYVVDTHNRIARVDGRYTHWVRGHSGGDRYSVIFFSTNPACATEVQQAVPDFSPIGTSYWYQRFGW